MTDFQTKITRIFIPFVLLMVSVIAAYTFLNWLFVIQLQWIAIDPEFTEMFVPAALVALYLLLFFSKPINLLVYPKRRGPFIMYFLMTLAITIPLVIAQMYLATATGKLTTLDSIYQIEKQPRTKYYCLNHFYFYKAGTGTYRYVTTSGKYNEKMNFRLYCAEPIFEKPSDTTRYSTHYWLRAIYREEMSNNSTDAEKEARFEEFIKKSEARFRLSPRPHVSFLERRLNADDNKYFGKAAGNSPLGKDGQNIFFTIHQKPFAERNGEKLKWIFIMAGIDLSAVFLLLLCFRLKSTVELDTERKEHEAEHARGWRKNYRMLLPHEGFYMTPLLLYANVIVFLAMVVAGLGFVNFDGGDLIPWGSLYKPMVLQGEWWRIFTYMFLHGGLMHLANNMVSLYLVGYILEPLLGRWRYLFVYIACGIGAGLTSFYWHRQLNSVGASGAIFGLYGFVLAALAMKVFDLYLNKMLILIAGVFVGVNLFMGLAGGVDNTAHIGGLITGFLLGMLLANILKGERDERNRNSRRMNDYPNTNHDA